jgi:hypothetical protein
MRPAPRRPGVMLIAGFDAPFADPNYLGSAVVGSIWLAEAAGWLAVGAAMLAVLSHAGATARFADQA